MSAALKETREEYLERLLMEANYRIGGLEMELKIRTRERDHIAERSEMRRKAVSAALGSLEEHSRLNVDPEDRDDEIIATVWETLEHWS